MIEKEKDSKQEKSKEHYDWRGNVAVYNERYGWHLRPTKHRETQEAKPSASKDKKLLDI